MAVLVTGGAGFVGMNLIEQLLRDGEQVVVFDRLEVPRSTKEFAPYLNDGLTSVVGDINDVTQVQALFSRFNIESVVHAAVITSNVTREAREPEKIVNTNIVGTANLLSAAHEAKCQRIVYVSSGQAYGETHDEQRPLFEELSPSRPDDLYGITKFAAEQIALRLRELWNCQVVCLRLGSVCGPWEFDTGVRDLLSPHLQIIQLALRGETAIIPMTEVWRDWIYSRDVAGGIVAALRTKAPSFGLYHLASGYDWGHSFAKWCSMVKQAYPRFSWRFAEPGELPNVSHRVQRNRSPMDIGRLVNDLHFKPRFTADTAFRDYIDWIGHHEDFLLKREGLHATTPAKPNRSHVRG